MFNFFKKPEYNVVEENDFRSLKSMSPYNVMNITHMREDSAAEQFQKENNIVFTADELRTFKLGFRVASRMR